MISKVLWSRFVKSSSAHDESKATLVLVKKSRKTPKEKVPAPERSPYRNEACNPTETANEPVDPTTEHEQWSFWPGC